MSSMHTEYLSTSYIEGNTVEKVVDRLGDCGSLSWAWKSNKNNLYEYIARSLVYPIKSLRYSLSERALKVERHDGKQVVLLLSSMVAYQSTISKSTKNIEIGISHKVVEYLLGQNLSWFSGEPLPLQSTS